MAGAGQTGPSTAQAAAAIAAASIKYGVPVEYLVGIYGHESAFGTAYKSGGTTYGFFGLTSSGLWNPSDSFAQDADIAAQTLSSLYKSSHSWDSALKSYSGGSYGQASAVSMATSSTGKQYLTAIGQWLIQNGKTAPGTSGPGGVAGALNSGAGAVGSAANAVAGAVTSTATIADLLTSGSFWLRVLEGVGGVVLLVLGLRALSGGDGNPITVATNAAGKAGKAAAVAA
jgi:hypothetical protein